MNKFSANNIFFFTTLIIGAVITYPAHSMEFQSISSIQTTATQFLRQQLPTADRADVSIHAAKVDPGLRFPACAKALEAFMPPGNDPLTTTVVGVRCNGENQWSLYVPVHTSVNVRILTINKVLTRGTVLQDSDVSPISYNVKQLPHGYFINKNDVIGKEIKRSVTPNTIITPELVKGKTLIKRGEVVTIQAQEGNLAVSMTGIAQNEGAFGDSIPVKNTSSGRLVTGTITGAQQVDVKI